MGLFSRSKKSESRPQPSEEDDFEDDQVLFQGAMSGVETDLETHQKLVRVGLPRAKALVSDALARRAEKLRIDPKGKAAQVALYVDGMPFSGGRLSVQEAMAITQVLKLFAGLDPGNRTEPQRGGIHAEFQEQKYELGVESQPLRTGGERLSVRMLNTALRVDTPTEAGFSDSLRELIREESSHKSGLILVAGTPDSGLSTTALATLRSIDAYLSNIYNLADLNGREIIHVTNFDEDEAEVAASTLDQKLARTIRKEADVAFVDPIDAESAPVVLEGSEEICIVGEMAAAGAAAGVLQFAEWVGSAEKAAGAIRLVLSPKLIRKLCTDCREAYRPNARLLQKVGLPDKTPALYRQPFNVDEETGQKSPVACLTCGGLGYYGRTVMVEVIRMTDRMRQVLIEGGSVADLKAVAREEEMDSLRTEGIRVVAAGLTSLEELQRTFKS